MVTTPVENPILTPLRGKTPIAHVARGAWQQAGTKEPQPIWELAVFDDGTLVYEGRRCVETGGLSVKHLDEDAMQAVHELIAAKCTDLPTAKSDEICIEHAATRVACADGEHVAKGNNRCTADEAERSKVDDFADELIAATEVDTLIGDDDSTDRQACEPGTPALAGVELRRVFPFEGEPAPVEPAERQASLRDPSDDISLQP